MSTGTPQNTNNTQMDASEFVVGLDIGTTKIAAIVGRKNEFGKIEILAIGRAESIGVKRGVVQNIEQTIESIKLAIADAENKTELLVDGKKLKPSIGEVNVGIAGQHIKSLQHRGMITRESLEDEVSRKDVNHLIDNMYKLVTNPGEEIIHVIPQDYVVDSEHGIKDPIGMAGIRLEGNFHIITGQIAAIKNINKCVVRSGLEVVDLNLEPLASADAVLTEEEREAGVVLVDIGGGTTDVAIFYDGIIRHTAVIPFGGDIITSDVAEGCGILKNQAELLKKKFGSALAVENQTNEIVAIPGLRGRPAKEISLNNLANIIQARVEEILELVYFEIKNSGFERRLSAGIVITGGGAQLKHLPQLVQYTTGLDCRIGYPSEHLGKSADAITKEIASPMYATGVGLVMKGIQKLEQEKKHAGANTFISKAAKEVVAEEKHVKPAINHSEKTRGNFFDKLLNKGKEWLQDDVE